MAGHIGRGMALIGFGLLLSFVGLVWVANLFGVADEHARRIAKEPWIRSILRWRFGEYLEWQKPMTLPGMKLGRYLAGYGFMVCGALIVVGGIAYLLAEPNGQ